MEAKMIIIGKMKFTQKKNADEDYIETFSLLSFVFHT